MVSLGPRVNLEALVVPEKRVWQGHLVWTGSMDWLDPKDLLEHQVTVRVVVPVPLELPVRREREAFPILEHLDSLGRREREDSKVVMVSLVSRVCLVPEERPWGRTFLDPQVTLVYLDWMEHKVSVAPQVNQALLVPGLPRETQVTAGYLASLAPPESKETQELPGSQD